MNRTDRVWSHFDAAFEKFDEGFAKAGEGFKEAERVMEEVDGEQVKSSAIHEIHFNSRGWSERFRLTKKFIKMAFRVLFTGKTQLMFRDR